METRIFKDKKQREENRVKHKKFTVDFRVRGV